MKTCRMILVVVAGLLSAAAVFGKPPEAPPARMAGADGVVKKVVKSGKKPKAVIPLVIDGDTVVVVKSLPCTVTAPAGADFYFWNLPAGVKGTADENVLTVTAAPKGGSTISVVIATINFTVDKDGKVTKVTRKDSGNVVLTNGTEPPVPPKPPTPADPFTALLQAAYDQDQDADREKSLTFLQAAYAGMPAAAQKRPDLKTVGDFVAWEKSIVQAPGVGLSLTQLKALRTAVAADTAKAWGTANVPLDSTTATAQMTKVANALSGVK